MHQAKLWALVIASCFVLLGCDNQIPKDQPLEISFTSTAVGAVRGLEEVRIQPDMKVAITTTSNRCQGEIPPWQYQRVVSAIRRMNVESRVKGLWMEEGGESFTLTVSNPAEPGAIFSFKGDQSSTYTPVLLLFQKVRHEIALNGQCHSATAISRRQETDES